METGRGDCATPGRVLRDRQHPAGVVAGPAGRPRGSTYTDALYNADVYDRVYTDVAGAPEISQGRVPARREGDPSYAIAQLRLLYPPDKLETTVEDMLDAFFTYIKGQDDRLGVNFDARPMIDFGLDELQGFTSIVSQRLGVVNVGTPAQFAATVRAFSADLQPVTCRSRCPR